MAIKHLQGKASLPIIGKIKKGQMDGKRPIDLPYFRFVCPDNSIQDKVTELFGEKPAEFTAFLFSDEPFTAWMQEWSTGSLLKRCDGEHIQLELQGDKMVNCLKPCQFPNCKCKPNSILKLMIKKVSPVGIFELTTNSQNDISHIDSILNGVKEISSVSGIPLSYFPILFKKEKVSISVPMNGKRVRMDKYLIKIAIHPLFIPQINKFKELSVNKFLLKEGE